MATIGTRANPAVVRVQTEERALELVCFCQDRRIQLIVELAPDEPEDVADVEFALLERQPSWRPGRSVATRCRRFVRTAVNLATTAS